MPQTLIVIFLLFFAVLAYAWFYWQRAKARDSASQDHPSGTAVADATTADATATDPARKEA